MSRYTIPEVYDIDNRGWIWYILSLLGEQCSLRISGCYALYGELMLSQLNFMGAMGSLLVGSLFLLFIYYGVSGKKVMFNNTEV